MRVKKQIKPAIILYLRSQLRVLLRRFGHQNEK